MKTGWIAVVLTVVCTGCDLGPTEPRAVFFPSGVPAATGFVRLEGATTGTNTLTLDVVIDGGTADAEVFAFNFGLVVDPPEHVAFVTGSQRPGPALDETGCADPLALVSPLPTGLTVGVTKLGPCGGHVLPPGSYTVISLDFELVQPGNATIRLGSSGPNPPAALDNGAQPIPGILFDLEPAAVSLW